MVLAAEVEQLSNRVIQMESAQTRIQQIGSQAVAELDVLMGAFRQELVLSRSEQTAAGEAFKEELRVRTGQLQAKFLEVEAGQQQARHQETEALKTELRTLVGQLEARFLTVEATPRQPGSTPFCTCHSSRARPVVGEVGRSLAGALVWRRRRSAGHSPRPF